MNRIRSSVVSGFRPASLAAGLVLASALMLALAGCATTEEDSDMPWNTQQSWEGGVAIPGFGGGDGF